MDVEKQMETAIRNGNVNEVARMVFEFGLGFCADWMEGYGLLQLAVVYNQLEVTQFLLTHGCKTGAPNGLANRWCEGGTQPLHHSVLNRHVELVKLLLQYGARVNHVCPHEKKKFKPLAGKNIIIQRSVTPLAVAAKQGNLEIAHILLDHGAKVNDSHLDGKSLLHWAVESNNLKLIELLLNRGAFMDKLWKNGGIIMSGKNFISRVSSLTPLHLALLKGFDDIVEFFLSKKPLLERRDTHYTIFIALECNPQLFHYLLDHGFSPDLYNDDGFSLLHFAAERNLITIVELLLQRGANIDIPVLPLKKSSKSYCSYTPLTMAIHKNHEEMVNLLMKNNANINVGVKQNFTPLSIAVDQASLEVVKLLLESGANPDSEDSNGNSILKHAVERGDAQILKLILTYNPCLTKKSNKSAFYTAILKSPRDGNSIVYFLFTYGFRLSVQDKVKSTVLHRAVEKGYNYAIKDYLETGGYETLNSLSRSGFSLLHTASLHNQLEIAELLIKFGADIDIKSAEGKTPLFFGGPKMTMFLLSKGANTQDVNLLFSALMSPHPEIIETFLSLGSNYDYKARNRDGDTLLHVAAKSSLPAISDYVKLFLGFGVRINSPNRNGNTPLHCAAAENKVGLCETLLEMGANVNSLNNDGQSPLHIASNISAPRDPFYMRESMYMKSDSEKESILLTVTLLKFCADYNLRDQEGNTPLHIACKNENYDLIYIFLKAGADISIKNNRMQMPFMFRCRNGKNILESTDCPMTIENLIVKMNALDLFSSDSLETILPITSSDDKFLEERCLEELLRLRTFKLGTITLFQLVTTKDPNKLINYFKNENMIREYFILKNSNQLFPIYWSIIEYSLTKVLKRRKWVLKGIEWFYANLTGLSHIPINCVENIMFHLSNRDIKLMTDDGSSFKPEYYVGDYLLAQ